MEVLEKLNNLLDEADPDVELPNIVHAFQTAERLRKVYPNEGWLHLTGLIHDAGKVAKKKSTIYQNKYNQIFN